MIKYNDLIYYRSDVVDEYSKKRKTLNQEEVEDLLRCIILFLEKSVKKEDFTAYEIPNIGFLHRKLDLSKLDKMTKTIKKEDNFVVESAYLETTYQPIVLRGDILENYYPEIKKQELQELQNDKQD